VLVIVAAIAAVVKLTATIGENLAPVRPRVLIFGATWCQYCPKEAAVQKLADDFPGADIEHIDVDQERSRAKQYGVRQLPTFIVQMGDDRKVFYSMTAVRAWLTNGETLQDTSCTTPWLEGWDEP